MLNVLYIFGGEKAQGAEIVIERLIDRNADAVNAHLILAPGKYADEIISLNRGYVVKTMLSLKKLNRQNTGTFTYLRQALGNFISLPFSINRYVKDNNIEIIHANTIGPSSYLIFLALYKKITRGKVKMLWSDHDLRYFTKLEQFLANACVRLYDCTMVVSNAVAKKYEKAKAKVITLYNGIDVNSFAPNVGARNRFREKWGIGKNDRVVGIVAVIHPDKGQLDLIKAFQSASNSTRKNWLLLAGNYTNQDDAYVEKVKAEIDVCSNIIHVGFISNVIEFYNGCDIIVNNSNNYRSESLGTTIYEAMACEKIVLGSNTGGTPEIISDGKDGYLFTADNVNALRVCLAFVFENLDNLIWMRHAARRKVVKKFNIEKMVQEYNTLIYNWL